MVKITFQGETREKIERQMRDWLGLSASALADNLLTREEIAQDSLFGKQPLPEGAAVPLPPAGTVVAAAPSPTAPVAPPVSSIAPPVPPSPVAASTSAPTATPAPAGDEAVDSSGMPWDERIHSSSRALVADGTWRKKRGVDPSYHERIEADIRSGLPVAPVPAAPAAPVPPVPAAPAAPASTGTTFPEAIRRIGPKLQDGTISQARLAEVLAANGGLTGLHELNSKPAAVLDAVLTALGV